ncbi:N-acetylmuramoyl-L-alanine amidase [hydrothermal vent metagenome]|uniref:N-acetylmuramoyl-L-alanine amidase n=1 Tax=hydrothermal vent metagenome TaxID=652676 RepID=A0A3B0YAE8_9ZZZZ
MKTLISSIIILLTSYSVSHAVTLNDARLWAAPDRTRIVFDVSSKIKYKVFAIERKNGKPFRIVIDMDQTFVSSKLVGKAFNTGLVQRIRSGRLPPRGLRIVLDLKGSANPRSFVLGPSGPYGHRLVIDLYKKGKLQNKRPRVVRSIYSNPKKKRSRRDIVVAIDAGHGGEDPGAIGKRGTKEKTIVLEMARRLARLVKKQPGMRAVLIRNGDYYINLKQRTRMARRYRADIFISLHANAAHRRSANGVSIYTLSKRGASNEAARWLAQRENKSDQVGGTDIERTGDRTLRKVLIDLSQTSTLSASSDIAQTLLSELRKITRVHGRGHEKARFVVLKAPDIPSVLVETGFISNPSEEYKLRSRKFQRKVARSIMSGIVRYFVQNAPHNTLFSRRRHITIKGETLRDIAKQYRVSIIKLKRINGIRNHRLRTGVVLTIPSAYGT